MDKKWNYFIFTIHRVFGQNLTNSKSVFHDKKTQKSQLKNAIIVSRFCHVFIIISYRKLLLIFIFYLIDIFIILKHTVAFFYNLGTTLS